ncbi:MAG: thiolase family protein [Acidobacteriota bacterium]
MRRVAIIGVGNTQFRARWIEKTYIDLAWDAAEAALVDAGIGIGDVQSAVYGIYNEMFERQFMPDIYVHGALGLALKPSTRVATGGATGGAAVRAGWCEVASGLHDVVMVLGVEKCTDCFDYKSQNPTPEVLKTIAYSGDMNFETPLGLTPATSYALPTMAHIARWGTPTPPQMALVSVKNHANAQNNPLAQSPKLLTVEDVLASRPICDPFRFYDNCLYSEGASCLLLASEDFAKRNGRPYALVTGIGGATDDPQPGIRPDLSELTSSRIAGERAYRMAGIGPRDLDFAELHDAFTAAEIMSYEAFGFCDPGEGGRLIEDGVTTMKGRLPCNASGGLIGCGHAVGATGVMQVGEAALQVMWRAGKRQVDGARRGLVQSIGGPATTWTFAIIVEAP